MKLFYAVTFLIFVFYIQSIGFGINIYGGVFNFSLNHQSIETFYYLVGAFDKNLLSQLSAFFCPISPPKISNKPKAFREIFGVPPFFSPRKKEGIPRI
jgi:hypothetical protein